jgi:hypothetical protein
MSWQEMGVGDEKVKNNLILVLLNLMLTPLTVNADLNELIQQNVLDADKSYEQIISTVEQPLKPSQLWIHVRSDNQTGLAEELYKQVSSANLPGIRIERKPLQFVSSGPRVSQLRYFKKEDGSEAQKLLETFRLIIPDLELKDFSSQYSHDSWIKRGHYELWFSAEVGNTDSAR